MTRPAENQQTVEAARVRVSTVAAIYICGMSRDEVERHPSYRESDHTVVVPLARLDGAR